MENLRDKFPLQRRKIVKKCINTFITVVVISGFVGTILYFQTGISRPSDNELIATVLTLGIFLWFIFALLLAIVYQILYFKNYSYRSGDGYLSIKKGVFENKEVVLPYDQITDVYVDQDLSDRLFGLYDLHLSTPTAVSLMAEHIDGLNKVDSESLKLYILGKIKSAKS